MNTLLGQICAAAPDKNEIAKLRDKAAETAEHSANQAGFYVRSGSGIFNPNHHDFSDVFTAQKVAEKHLQTFQWYLDDSPLVAEFGIDIEKEAAGFKERFAAFFEEQQPQG